MRLLLIVLLYLFTPLYFAALQAGASLSSSQQAGLFSIVANNASNISSTADTPLYSFLSTDNLKQVLNFSVDAIKKVGKVAAEFIDHPVSQITETGAKILRDLFSGYYSHMNQATQVYPADKPVSIVTEIGSGMHTFHLQRSYHVRDALNQYFGISTTASSVPKIALTVSGGGMRACLCTAGFLAGAEQTGLLDCVMYNAAISGGSWAVGSASYLFAKTNPRITFTQFKNNIVKKISTIFEC